MCVNLKKNKFSAPGAFLLVSCSTKSEWSQHDRCAIVHPTTIWCLEASQIGVAGAGFFILNYVATSLDSLFLHKI